MLLLFCTAVGLLLVASYLTLYFSLAHTFRTEFDGKLASAAHTLANNLSAVASPDDLSEVGAPGYAFELFDARGRVVEQSKPTFAGPLALPPGLGSKRQSALWSVSPAGSRHRIRAIAVPIHGKLPGWTLLLAAPTSQTDRALAVFGRLMVVLLALNLVLLGLVSWFYVRRSLEPLAQLTERIASAAARLRDRGFQRAPIESLAQLDPAAGRRDELGRLTAAFGDLARALGASWQQLQQFVSDASHELRTPLSILRGETELLLRKPRTGRHYVRALRVIDTELRNLGRIVEGLFTLSMADAGRLSVGREPVLLGEVLGEACELVRKRARAKNIAIESDVAAAPELAVLGDEGLLRELFLIFLDNAIKYSPDNTTVHARLARFGGGAQVIFRDQGVGIPPQHLSRIFERFYRVPMLVESENHSGGLGLAIAKAIAEAHGGSIRCASEVGRGSTFTVVWGAAVAAAAAVPSSPPDAGLTEPATMSSIFELFRPGIGPSSSHTVGPMRAARRFLVELEGQNLLPRVDRIAVELFGSLALTGRGHATDRAVLLGLGGAEPETVDPAGAGETVAAVHDRRRLALLGGREISFDPARDLVFRQDQVLAGHSNGLCFTARAADGGEIARRVFYSVGGGAILAEGESPAAGRAAVRFPFRSAADLLRQGEQHHMPIWAMVLANESGWRAEAEVRAHVAALWAAMRDCMERGLQTDGVLPGGLHVERRAPRLCRALLARDATEPLAAMDWISVFAIAVNEENAAGGRVVTAPTNGAAGVIPAVARYYEKFLPGADQEGLLRFFLTAGAIGLLYRDNASISGAEVGCQGEVGVACSMAAAGLVAAQRGDNRQVEHAAEIAMEHNLGMTCDPVAGLVQIPCIERNAFGAVKAVNAARLARSETGSHKVSLDEVIRTMYETGRDMQARYKETSLAGLAANVVEC